MSAYPNLGQRFIKFKKPSKKNLKIERCPEKWFTIFEIFDLCAPLSAFHRPRASIHKHIMQAHVSSTSKHIGDAVIMVDVIKVSARSRSTAVAGAIAGVVREHRRAEVQAIGAGAVNQAVKAAAIARGYLADDGIDVICIPYFTEVNIEDQERTALRLIVEPRIPNDGVVHVE